MPDPNFIEDWQNISKQFDPYMPQKDYDQRRASYFYAKVAPQLGPGWDLPSQYKAFFKNTERPPLMGTSDRIITELGIAATAGTKAMIAPTTLIPGVKDIYQKIDSDQALFKRAADRDKIGTGIAEGVGELAGMSLPIEGLLGMAGELAPVVTKALLTGARAQENVARIARGGLAFAGYNALSEQDNDKRIISGLKGAVAGAAGELLLLPFGKSAEKAMVGQERLEPAKDIGAVKDLQESAQVAKQEKRPVNVTSTTTLKQGTVNAIVKDAEGNVSPIDFRKGAHQTGHAKVNDVINAGGEIVGFEHHPDQLSRVQEILNRYQTEIEPKYTEGKVRVKTSAGGTVDVPGTYEHTESTAPKPPTVEITDEELRESGLFGENEPRQEGPPPPPPGQKLRVQWPDAATQRVFNLGSLRNTSKFRGQTRAVTGDIYSNMNHIAGDLGEEFGIPTREHVGNYALDYYTKTAAEMEKLQPGEVYSPPSVKSELQALSESTGGTPGVRPAPFKTLQAKRAEARAAFQAEKPPLKSADLIIPPGEQVSKMPGETIEEAMMRAGVRIKPKEGTIASSVVTVPGEVSGPQGMTIRGEGGPIVVLTENAPKDVRLHEYIHSGMNVVGSDELIMSHIAPEHRSTAMAIAAGLKGVKTYANDSLKSLLNEATVHGIVGVAKNQTAVLETLGRMDTDVPTVVSFVNSTVKSIIDHAASQIDSMPARILGRMLRDVERRSSPDISHTLFRAMDQIGGSAHFDANMGLWLLKDSAGNETAVKDLHKAWDWIANHDGSDMLPSVSFSAELGGVRGPIVPHGTEPGEGSILPDFSAAEIPGLAANAVEQYFAPTLGAVGRLDQKVNQVLNRYGDHLPLYDGFRETVNKSRDFMSARMKQQQDFQFIGKGVEQERWHDYFEMLTKPADQWDSTAKALGLSKEGLETADKLKLWRDRFETETGLPVKRYMEQDFNTLRDANFNHKEAYRTMEHDKGDFFEHMAYTGKLNAQDTHLGRFAGFLMKENYAKQMEPYLKKLEEMVGRDAEDSAGKNLGPARYPMQNYIRYMRGIPDRSAEMINGMADSFLKNAGEKAAELNKHLPANAQLPTDWGQGRSAVNRTLQFLTAAGVGGRPATLVRDLFASLNTMYVVGPLRFAKAATRLMTKEGWAEADRLGFFMPAGRSVGSTWGEDILGELNPYGKMDALSRGVDKLLAPNRIAHNISRGIAGFSEYDAALDAIGKYRAGDLTALRKNTSWWHADKAPQAYLERIAFDKSIPIQEAAKAFANQIVEDTQFGFSRGTQPAALRTGIGRIFGQYGSFPAHYLEYVRRLGRKAILEQEPRGMLALGGFVATQYAAYKAAEAVGVDISKWVGLSSAGYSGGPAFEAVLAGMRAPENSQQGRDARKQLLEFATGTEFVPGSVQMHYLWKGLGMEGPLFDNNGVPTQKMWTMLGFATIPPNPGEPDFEEWARWESGFGKKR